MTLFARWSATLADLRGQDRFRRFALPLGHDFTSNDYLGYGTEHGIDASQLSPSGMASRLLRGHHAVWEDVESALAAWHGSETALMMTSGYAANEGLLSTILEPGDWVASDELVHACILDGLRLARPRRFNYRHNDLAHLEEGLQAEAAKGDPDRARFIITESLFSMDGDRAPLAAIVDLAERYGTHVIVDEAHSTGCYNVTGSGCVDEAGVRSRVLASVHTGGKGLAVMGAYIACGSLLKDYLINRCRHLIFTTALPAVCGTWWQQRLPQVQADQERRARLHSLTRHFRDRLKEYGIEAPGDTYVVPVILGDNGKAVTAARKLQEQGFDVRAIRPPSVPPGTARLRISIHANHDQELLDQLARAVGEVVAQG